MFSVVKLENPRIEEENSASKRVAERFEEKIYNVNELHLNSDYNLEEIKYILIPTQKVI